LSSVVSCGYDDEKRRRFDMQIMRERKRERERERESGTPRTTDDALSLTLTLCGLRGMPIKLVVANQPSQPLPREEEEEEERGSCCH
jgi:hypothetical protein